MSKLSMSLLTKAAMIGLWLIFLVLFFLSLNKEVEAGPTLHERAQVVLNVCRWFSPSPDDALEICREVQHLSYTRTPEMVQLSPFMSMSLDTACDPNALRAGEAYAPAARRDEFLKDWTCVTVPQGMELN